MKRVTIRLPENVVRAYDSIEANRSQVMRHILTKAVADGDVPDVPDDLVTLAQKEEIVTRGALGRSRGDFRKRCADFFKDRWQSGYVSPSDVLDMKRSWRKEAYLYGDEYVEWVDAVTDWFYDNWEPFDREPWPEPGTFFAMVDPESVEYDPIVLEKLVHARDTLGLPRNRAVERLSKFNSRSKVEAAAAKVYGDM